jgi:hypothetical protein
LWSAPYRSVISAWATVPEVPVGDAARPLPEIGDAETEHRVDAVGDVDVVDGDGVGVVAKRRRWVAMAEACLGLEEFAVGDELGADAVAEPVQRGVG